MVIFDVFKKKVIMADNKPQTVSDPEMEFLKYCDLKIANLDSFSKTFQYRNNLDYPKTVNKLTNLGYLSYCDTISSLQAYKTNDLKAALKDEGLPVTGDKQALIERLKNSNANLSKYFTQKVFMTTATGQDAIAEYDTRKLSESKNRISITIEALRSNNYERVYPLFESKSDVKTPCGIGYNRDNIKKDMDALRDYIALKTPSEPELIMAIVTLTSHSTYDGIQKHLSKLGYNDFSKEQIGNTNTLLISLRELKEFQKLDVKKYKVSSVDDGKTCPHCKKHDKKIYPVSKAVIGKTAPPFCNSCRCVMIAVWD